MRPLSLVLATLAGGALAQNATTAATSAITNASAPAAVEDIAEEGGKRFGLDIIRPAPTKEDLEADASADRLAALDEEAVEPERPAAVSNASMAKLAAGAAAAKSAGPPGTTAADAARAIQSAERYCAAAATTLCADGAAPAANSSGAGGGDVASPAPLATVRESLGCLLRLAASGSADANGAAPTAPLLGDAIPPTCGRALSTLHAVLLHQPLLDPRLAAACEGPIRGGVCRDEDGGAADGLGLMRCLRSPAVRARLPADCRDAVTRRMLEEARNLTLDVQLHRACSAELAAPPCSLVAAGGGARRACLQRSQYLAGRPEEARAEGEKVGAAPPQRPMGKECAHYLSLSEIERADDVRFHAPLLQACAAERASLCADFPAGASQVLSCLLRHRTHRDTSPRCAARLLEHQQRRMADFRLDPTLTAACADDIVALCPDAPLGKGAVIACLIRKEAEVAAKPCAHEVHQLAAAATSDVRLNAPLYEACAPHVLPGGVCGSVPPGQGRVLECLKSQARLPNGTAVLGAGCAAEVASLAQTQARDVHYNAPIVAACAAELHDAALCGGVSSHGEGEVLHCLEEKRLEPAMSGACEAAVTKDFVQRAASVDTLVALRTVCAADLALLCGDVLRLNSEALIATGLSREQVAAATREINAAAGAQASGRASGGTGASDAPLSNSTAVVVGAQVAPRLTCLRRNMSAIGSPLCKERVHGYALAVSENALANAPLAAACSADISKHCAAVQPGGGRVLDCLERVARTRAQLAPQCAEQVLSQMAAELADPSTSFGLRRDCSVEVSLFCKAAAKGRGLHSWPAPLSNASAGNASDTSRGTLDCLRSHSRALGFRPACAVRVASLTRTEMSDSRLMLLGGQLSHCREEAAQLCPNETAASKSLPVAKRYTGLMQCLQAKHAKLPEGACRVKVRSSLRVLAYFPTANSPLLAECRDQFTAYCGAPDGVDLMEDDALLRCLREHRALFTGGCRAKVMSIERMAHNEMDFNAEVSEACAVELRTQCRGVDSRQQLSCLERMGEVRAAKLAPTCSRVLQGFKERAAQSVELMGKVSSVCREDYELLCASASALQHPGASIQCLKDSRGQLRSKDCKAAVLGLMAGASRDSRLDAMLQSQCGRDLFECTRAGVLPGEGRLLKCLKEKLSKLQPSCAAQLRKTVHAEAEDVRVNFEVSKACEAELHHYCASVKPEGALGCLELHLGGSDFGAPCATAVRATMRLALQDYRLHPQVKAACEPTLPRVCPTVPPGEGAVLRCLLDGEGSGNLTDKACARAIRQAARSAFVSYTPRHAITDLCDDDIGRLCAAPDAARRAAALRGAPGPLEESSLDLNGDSELVGAELWPCLSHKAHAEPTSFRSSACASLVERLSLDPKVSLEEAEERAKELSETLSKSSRKQRALLKKVRAAKAETSASRSEGDAERDRALAEMRAVQSEIGVKTTELSALREKLAYAEAMREEAERLQAEAQARLSSGVVINRGVALPMLACGVGLAARVLYSRATDPALKGYTVVQVPKDG